MNDCVRTEERADYCTTTERFRYSMVTPEEQKVLDQAAAILERLFRRGDALTSPALVQDYLQAKLAAYPYEVFAVVWLDTRHKVIEYEELFKGTIDGAGVYPREIVRSALHHNAAAAVLVHNHPSGNSVPSTADKRITARIKDVLEPIDVRVLDHTVVGETMYSFAEHGLL